MASDELPAELYVTWDELNAASFNAPVRRVARPDGHYVAYRDSGEAVAVLVARKLGVRLVVERDTDVITYDPAPERGPNDDTIEWGVRWPGNPEVEILDGKGAARAAVARAKAGDVVSRKRDGAFCGPWRIGGTS